MSNFSLQGKTSIITGGAGGLGRAMVAAYAAAGANVVVASRNQEKIEAEAAGIRDKGQSAIAIAADITDSEQVEHLVSKTVETFGALDVMVNNAGRWGRSHLAEETPLEEWRIVVDQNLTGVFIPCMAAGKQMIRQQFGKIINISSTAGSKGNPHQLHYSAAKAGVISLTNNLAYMWAKHNINVNCILPGLIATEELKGYGIIPTDTDDDGNAIPKLELTPNPENVADLALFLASPASDALTGELYPIRAWLKSERFWQ
ncbi:MAG: SDR family NAD(P)-dependent oxidoreductase [Candidatus Azotimanducaceae bacterium]|jgi:NAD(P)-dependent dehydrogenase (short-subunit alcohol dehydrogenase family)|nr:SDR family oxidoreductase [Pseudomonadales bacterium]